MRPVRDRDSAPTAPSHTPIYDTLCSEYLRAFRALPGDRTGEEDLAFTAFSYGGSYTGSVTVTGTYGGGWSGSGWQPEPWQPAYAPVPVQMPQPTYAYAATGTATGMYAGGRQHQTGMHHIPAALPPAPRRGY
ncbi:hypothetical protein HYE82_23535 [Streptomyces sp. BR123]|uniref:hypothetical protein n=1 Tax=Streptomyces sp. BR123 TaxID=2749828 RepID=UPI0015C4C2A1|nr:hypothetical protein [Streptomyces sp. BR123]NXY97294.1 hypothetical protein [Streptomyces sp. BR123]